LVDGQGAAAPEIIIVVDTAVPDPVTGGPTVDWGLPVELPLEVLHNVFAVADVVPVIVRNGVILHSRGQLDLARTTRIANRAQRRALRALYPTCAVPGCGVRFELCHVHHVIWWRHGGRTDIVNLVPLCNRHHHAVHDLGWQLTLTADRTLTITYPDGTSHSSGPPRRGPRREDTPTPNRSRPTATHEPEAPMRT
jgi:hypothetical protein